MAFPWQLAFLTLEKSAIDSALGAQHRLEDASHHLQFSPPVSDWISLEDLTAALVIGEADEAGEGDSHCAVAIDLAIASFDDFFLVIETSLAPALRFIERSTYPPTQHLCLRC